VLRKRGFSLLEAGVGATAPLASARTRLWP
jgi:hypothetical protein